MKGFLKEVSIYGVLPVIGKFAGFFLVPIYARVFSSYEFGIVELIVTLVSFLLFACNLEFYSAIGRFFYDCEDNKSRKKLISTGLFLTIITTIVVSFITYIFEENILNIYLEGDKYFYEFRVAIIWLLISPIYTYLGVIPRYEQKSKLYVIINVSGLLLRILSTIIFVIVLKTGIVGVLYGHIIGSISLLIMNLIASKKYLGFTFSYHFAKEIFGYSVPLVPGILLIGFWQPLTRSMISDYFSIAVVGLFSFASRITSVMDIANSAIKLSWGPMLFENYKKDSFHKDIISISNKVAFILFAFATLLTLLSPEISTYIGTKEYTASSIFIGFLSFRGVLEILRRLRGVGPSINKKTYIITINEIIGIVLGYVFFILVNNQIGFIGIGFVFVIPSLIKYILLINYTQRVLKINFFNKIELFYVFTLISSIIIIFFDINIIYRIFFSVIFLIFYYLTNYSIIK